MRSRPWNLAAAQDALCGLMARDPYILAKYGALGTHCPIVLHASGATLWCLSHDVAVPDPAAERCPRRIMDEATRTADR